MEFPGTSQVIPKFTVWMPLNPPGAASAIVFAPVQLEEFEEHPSELLHRVFPAPKWIDWSLRFVPNTKHENAYSDEPSFPRTTAPPMFTLN
jgi:hypothetical protein